ncbi:hypothetical protein E4U15_003130 [Claviceps sp. LM218 group G6]|nr:hypothetical protein E4U15_003130 [Claviceps sp. LM218 group G6]
MRDSAASLERTQTPVTQPVARLEYICCLDGRVTKEKGTFSKSEEILGQSRLFPLRRIQTKLKISSDFAIKSDREKLVSRNHCEIYTVVYEPGINHIYVRDRKSFNGTYVNKLLVGQGPDLCSGFLLQDGDIIEILPYWKFILHQENSPPSVELSKIQLAESRFVMVVDESYKKQIYCDNYDTSFIFTELAAGGDLMSLINRHNRLKEFDCRIIIRQVLRGLSYLHSKGIIHRDLKPENILLAYSPKMAYHRVMLSDFATCAIPRRSRLKTMVGTANYQAPELHTAPHDDQTPAVDMWAVGIVTAIMLTASSETDEVIAKLCQSSQDIILQYLRCNIFRPDLKLSKNSKKFVWQCLQRHPQDRLTAFEAECHDWLCTPVEHLRFFKQLDRRVLGDWKVQEEFSPLPLQLPSVLMSSLAAEQDQDELFKSYLCLARRHPLLQSEFPQYLRNLVFRNQSPIPSSGSQLSTKAVTRLSYGARDHGSGSTLISETTLATDAVEFSQDTAHLSNQRLDKPTKRRLSEPCHFDQEMKTLRRKTDR